MQAGKEKEEEEEELLRACTAQVQEWTSDDSGADQRSDSSTGSESYLASLSPPAHGLSPVSSSAAAAVAAAAIDPLTDASSPQIRASIWAPKPVGLLKADGWPSTPQSFGAQGSTPILDCGRWKQPTALLKWPEPSGTLQLAELSKWPASDGDAVKSSSGLSKWPESNRDDEAHVGAAEQPMYQPHAYGLPPPVLMHPSPCARSLVNFETLPDPDDAIIDGPIIEPATTIDSLPASGSMCVEPTPSTSTRSTFPIPHSGIPHSGQTCTASVTTVPIQLLLKPIDPSASLKSQTAAPGSRSYPAPHYGPSSQYMPVSNGSPFCSAVPSYYPPPQYPPYPAHPYASVPYPPHMPIAVHVVHDEQITVSPLLPPICGS